jgi:hypothetical protein
MNKKVPNFFIVGHPKCGTTALHAMLDQHPDVYMCKDKEPKFFCKDYMAASQKIHGHSHFYKYQDLSDYLRLFSDVKNEKIIGESSVQYLSSHVAAKEIYDFNPQSKILILLREPVSFMFSLQRECYRRARDDVEDFEAALALEQERRQGKSIPPHCHSPLQLYYKERTRYAEQVSRYLDVFGPDNVKVIIYEDFKEDNLKYYQNTLAFLGIDTTFHPQIVKKQMGGDPKFPRLNKIIIPFFLKHNLFDVLPDQLRSFLKAVYKKIFWYNKNSDTLSPQLRQKLKKQCLPEVKKVSALLQMDLLTKWKYEDLEP